MKTRQLLTYSILALFLAACGSSDHGGDTPGGGNTGGETPGSGGTGGGNNPPGAALQGIWQSAVGASIGASAIVLPDGKVWAVLTEGSSTLAVVATLAAHTTGLIGDGKAYLLGAKDANGNPVVDAIRLTANGVEKSSLTGTIATNATPSEPFSLAYQPRYDTTATLGSFAGTWRDVQGPGVQNWTISPNGALAYGTRTTGCTYVGQLSERAERKAVVDVAVTEDCAGQQTQLQGVATLNGATALSMLLTTADEKAAVALSMTRQ